MSTEAKILATSQVQNPVEYNFCMEKTLKAAIRQKKKKLLH